MTTFCKLSILLLLLWPQIARPQTPDQTRVREIHVLKAEEGDTRLILRFPLLLAYANELSGDDDMPDFAAPFVLNSEVSGVLDGQGWRLDSVALLDDYDVFSDFLLRDYRFTVGDRIVVIDTPEFVVIDGHDPDATDVNICLGLASTAAMLSLCTSDYPDRPLISETLIVMSLYLADVMPADALKIELLAKPFKTDKAIDFETQITDYRSETSQTYVLKGVVFDPVILGGAGEGALPFRHYGLALLLVLGGGFAIFHRRRNRR